MIRKLFAVLIFIVFIATTVSANIPIAVKVSPQIERAVEYFNLTKNITNGYQEFSASIYNIGSVGCNTRLRFDIYNSTSNKSVATVWSGEKPLEAGSYDDFHAYWHAFNVSGKFHTQMKIYQCNEMFTGPVERFEINNKIEGNKSKEELIDKDVLEIENIENDYKSIKFHLNPKKNFESIIIYPSEYDPGWIVQGEKIKNVKKGEKITAEINYSASIWKEKEITFALIDENNTYYSEISYKLKKENKLNEKDILISALAIVLFISIFLNIRNEKLKKRKKKNKIIKTKK